MPTRTVLSNFRMGVFEIVMAVAVFTGSLSSSYVFNATSYIAVYSIATLLCFAALLFTIFFIRESLETREDTVSLRYLKTIAVAKLPDFPNQNNKKKILVLAKYEVKKCQFGNIVKTCSVWQLCLFPKKKTIFFW